MVSRIVIRGGTTLTSHKMSNCFIIDRRWSASNEATVHTERLIIHY